MPAIATDLDGTLVHADGSISARARDALSGAERVGWAVVLVTGRPPRWMPGVADAVGHAGLAVCANGALVYDLRTERVVESFPLLPEAAMAVVAVLRAELPELAFGVEHGAGFGHEPSYQPRWPVPAGTAVAAVEQLLTAGPVVKLLARHPELLADDLLARAQAALGDLATVTHSNVNDRLLEVSAAGVSKATTLERVCASHGVIAADVVAFGDMPNDLPMLDWAGHSVAVANAHPDVLRAVDEVTASNDDDGVAVVVERLLAR